MEPTREELIAAQMENYPDSRILTEREVWDWITNNHDAIKCEMDYWDEKYGPLYEDKYERRVARDHAAEVASLRYQVQVARSIAVALSDSGFDSLVFYECGKREDGSYAWRGARYGVRDSQYISGFGRI
jgi:hypothetical protein